MTQKEFGRRTGIPQSTISDWKGKQLNPASDKILIICDVLEVSPYELLGAAESSKYVIPDHVIVQKDTEEYVLIERYRKLGKDQRERLLGYMEAIRNL
jgi:transcriptional regulator with XRE-family HTH domain